MKKQLITLALLVSGAAHGNTMPHKMQHGFILSQQDRFATHLVATGHHSWQANVSGKLDIANAEERTLYIEKRSENEKGSKYFFLLQAQDLDLPTLSKGQVLHGHIIMSKIGSYEPKNKIVSEATFTVDEVLLNLVNPFFIEE